MLNEKPMGRIRQENRQKILSAAELEFAECGFKGASVNKIAQRANLPKANIHYYFGNKEALYQAVLANILSLWDDSLHQMKPEDDPHSTLSRYIKAKITFARQYPYASRIFAKEVLSGAPHLSYHFGSGYHEWFIGRTAVFDAWIAQGKMTAVNTTHLLFLLWSSTQHYADFNYQISAAMGCKKLHTKDYDQAAETLVSIILRGCGIDLNT